ncbi:MAG TPA: polyribonucleotide nucleotidyltransferase, partial [Sulfurovum sp.]|nr:polyribonucleotide nucleotidyltransferase [Sulfurovum sp.]
MNETIIEISNNNLEEHYTFNKVAKQASGAVMYKQGKAVLIAAVAIDEKAVDEDFLPLTVQYMEKSYAAAKIPGGFIKRETKPGDFETLTSRIIDRSLRPLFPQGFNYPVTITVMVVSSDENVDLQVAGLHAVNAALFVSDIPVSKSIAAVRVGTEGDDLVINPTLTQQEKSELDLLVVGSGSDVVMIEMRTLSSKTEDGQSANEFSEEALVDVIAMAVESIEGATAMFEKQFSSVAREPLDLAMIEDKIDTSLYSMIENEYTQEVEKAIAHMAKSERSSELKKIRMAILERLENEGKASDKTLVAKALERYKSTVVRTMILDKNLRADGRTPDEVRPISIETNLLPSVHGSCLFTRGQTQALVSVTLGDKKDAQMYELIT